jgi:hypothetical protein
MNTHYNQWYGNGLPDVDLNQADGADQSSIHQESVYRLAFLYLPVYLFIYLTF